MAFHGAAYDGKLNPVAQDDRQAAVGWSTSPGILNAGDLACAAGSGMNSVMAAGRGLVLNNYAPVQGGLWLVRNDASVTVSPAHVANVSGNPRIDAVGVRVYDSETGGDSSDTTTALPITGTASASASLTLSSLNLTGAPGQSGGPALPNNFLLITYVLVPNGASSAAAFTYLNVAPVAAPPLEIVSPSSTMMLAGGTRTIANAGSSVYLPVNAIAGTKAEVQAGAGVTGSSPVTVRGSGATIKGPGLSATSFTIGAPYVITTLMFDGTVWDIVRGQPTAGDLRTTTKSASYTAVDGDYVIVNASCTITLPPPALNATVGVVAGSGITGTTPVTITTNGGQMNLDAPSSLSTSITLGISGSFIVLQSDGTNWYPVAGQPDSGWVPLTLGSGITASGSPVPGARLQGDTVRLRGTINPPSGGLAQGATAATVAYVSQRPAYGQTLVTWSNNTAELTFMSTSGVITFGTTWANYTASLDGVTYPVT